MKVETFTVQFGGGKSFYARVDDGQKITVVDAFCVLESDPLPVCVGMCSLSAKMHFDRGEEGARQIRISIMDEHGKLAIPSFETTMDVKIPKHTVTVPFAFLIKQLSLPAFGFYSVDLAVDGRLAASTSLYARQKA